MQESKIHSDVIAALTGSKGVKDVRGVFEIPNRYGKTVSHISFRYDVKDDYNYPGGSLTIEYKSNKVFMPDIGYFVLDSLNAENIISLVKEKYKL